MQHAEKLKQAVEKLTAGSRELRELLDAGIPGLTGADRAEAVIAVMECRDNARFLESLVKDVERAERLQGGLA